VISWRKRMLFATVAILLACSGVFAALLGADLYVHHRSERYAGLNIWGYRGPTVTRKQRNERRLVVLGGSTAFGYGVDWDKAFPAQLQSDLRPLAKNGAPVTVINLGMNSQGAYSFRFTLEDYLRLDYDAVVLYEGYNDLGDSPNEYVGRRESPIFRLTGYYPVLAVALREKAMALRTGGDLQSAYYGRKTVFRPGLAARTTAGALDAAALVNNSLNAQLERLSKVPPAAATFADVHVADYGCSRLWAFYCASVHDGVQFALDHDKKALVVTQPIVNDMHREQQSQMRAMLAAQFGRESRVAYVDLGHALDLSNHEIAYDGMHLNPEGNAIVARDLVAPLTRLMSDVFDAPVSGKVAAQ
jgi:lysophospholipase L1-like esterase